MEISILFVIIASVSITLNLVFAAIFLYHYNKTSMANPYDGLKELMRDDNWSRIDTLDDMPRPSGFKTYAIGNREKIKR